MLYITLLAKLFGILVAVLGLIELKDKSLEHKREFRTVSESEAANGVTVEIYDDIIWAI